MTGDTVYQPGNIFTIGNDDVVLTAIWIPVHNVIYDGNGADTGSVPVDTLKYPSGARVTVKGNSGGLNRNGYYGLSYWTTEPDGSGDRFMPGSALKMGDSDVTLYAQYSTTPPGLVVIYDYGVSYNGNGADSGSVPGSVEGETPITISGNTGYLFKEGYAFAGWNTAPDGSGRAYAPGDVYDQVGYITLYAQWAAASSVNYMVNANAADPGISRYYAPGTKVKLADYDDVITEPPAGVFMGWNTEAYGTGTTYTPGDVITLNSDLKLYPMWGYIITFDGNGNTDGSLPPRQISAGGTIVLPQQGSLNREGYVFAGWTTDGGQFYYPDTTVEVNKSTTFYASWIKTYKVTYDANGGDTGTVPVDNTAYMEDTAAKVKDNTGYLKKGSLVFAYWNTEPDGSGDLYKPGDSIIINTDTTLYAIYTESSGDIPIIFVPNFCELSYNGNMSDGGSVPENAITYTGGTTVEVKGNTGNLSRSGYKFIGWNTRPDGSGLTFQDGDILTIPGDRDAVTLFAMWQKEPGPGGSSRVYLEPYHYYDFGNLTVYYISYYSTGAEGGTPLRQQDDGPEGYVITLPYCGTLYKTGYHFAGWRYETINGLSDKIYKPGEQFTIKNPGSERAEFIPVWEEGESTYHIIYRPGYYKDSKNLPTDNNSYIARGQAVISLEIPTYSLQEFLCWNTRPDGTGVNYYPGDIITFGASDVILYPVFTASHPNIIYHGNGNTGGYPPASTYEYLPEHTVTVRNQNTMTKGGYYLAGWNTQPDGTGTTYQPGDTFTMGYYDINLYAIWKEIPDDTGLSAPITPIYTVTYHSISHTSGDVPVDSGNYKKGNTVVLQGRETLRRDGYNFIGWSMDNNLYKPGSSFTFVNRPFTFYAVWLPADQSQDTFTTIYFNGNGNTGGTVPDSIICSNGQSVVLPQNTGNLTRAGYVFAGWRDNVNIYKPGQSYYAETGQDVTLYAVWIPGRTVSYDGNKNTGGSVPAETTAYPTGETVTILDNINNLVRYNYLFAGWFIKDKIYYPGETIVIGSEDIVASAVWAPVNDAPATPEDPVTNTAPNRKAGVPEVTTAVVNAGDIYRLDLSDIFEDSDADTLTYHVSANGSPFEAANDLYEYSATAANAVTLVFKASDGKTDSVDTYTVILTVQSSSGGGETPDGGGTTGDSETHGGGSGSKNTSGSNSDDTYTGENTPTDFNNEVIDFGSTVTVVSKVASTIDGSGKATATIQKEQMDCVVNTAVAKAEQSGGAAKIEVRIDAHYDAAAVEVSISQEAISTVANNGVEALTLSTSVAEITFDKYTLRVIANEAVEDIRITATKVNTEELGEEARQIVGDRPVYKFSIASGDKIISRFGGYVTVTVPYTLKEGEDINAIVIYYINEEGRPEIVNNCVYDPVTGTISFTTNHFSKYAVGYNKVSFNDVPESVWYGKAVGFIAARGITTGTGNGNYSPDKKLTRGEFLVMLMKVYGIAPDESPSDNFSDAGNTYYTGYLGAAKRLGISAGLGGNMFAPDREITREEMFAMLYNALKSIGKLPKGESGKTLSDFADADLVSSWAMEAAKLFVKMGVIEGYDGRLAPKATTTRAEFAQVLYNLMTE